MSSFTEYKRSIGKKRHVALGRDGFLRDPQPWVSVVNFSGGRQSTCILHKVLNGELRPPESAGGRTLVLTADPGMEKGETYDHIRHMHELCEEAGIEAIKVAGPNLKDDLVQLRASGKSRLDNPPYWVKKADGSRGRLQHKCTREYKVRPMDRALRAYLEREFGIRRNGRPRPNIVEKWIGFSAEEYTRISEPDQRYMYFRYPLIEMGMTKEDTNLYFKERGLYLPPPSVCNACFANTVDTYREMRSQRPDDFEQACLVDESVRDLSAIGVKGEVFVSPSLRPIRELVDDEKITKEDEDLGCEAGYCFL